MGNTMTKTRILPLLLVLALATVADAKRANRPMGEYIREAGLIVIGNTQAPTAPDFSTAVTVTEVLQGDPTLFGKTIVLPSIKSTAEARVPAPATDIAILLTADWEKQPNRPVLEAYSDPAQIAALRLLVADYGIPGERPQLLALREHALAGPPQKNAPVNAPPLALNALCLTQLFADLRRMRDPNNFDLLLDLYKDLAPADQTELVSLMGEMGDARAVSLLLKAMQSPDEKVGSAAAHELRWHFPGAPGVTDAFESALAKKHLSQQAASYLAKRRDDPALDAILGPGTPWMHAEALSNAGKREQARAAFLAILEDPQWNSYTTPTAAFKLLPDATAAEKDRIRKALLPQLAAVARSGNYLEIENAARILRALRHPDTLEPLLAILPRTESLYASAARTATLAIRELGPAARKQAATLLIGKLSAVASVNDSDATTRHLLQLVYLADKDDLATAARAMPEPLRASWAAAAPLQTAANDADECAALNRALENAAGLARPTRQWALYRLGDLKDPRAMPVLKETIIRESDWTLTQAARDSLINIGSPEVEKEMLPLLTHENRDTVRPIAIEVLFGIQGVRGLGLARRMLREDDFGLKQSALMHFSTYGTPEDLPLLLPSCDYWKSDRATHPWALSAVTNIRDRFNYDLNGPIVKTTIKK